MGEILSVQIPKAKSKMPVAMNTHQPRRLRQIRLSPSQYGCQGEQVNYPDLEREQEAFKDVLSRLLSKEYWAKAIFNQSSPNPIVISKGHQRQLSELHTSLVLAIVDIVERWWTDDDARFPERMPLEAQEEELLQVCRSLLLFPPLKVPTLIVRFSGWKDNDPAWCARTRSVSVPGDQIFFWRLIRSRHPQPW